MQNSNYLIILLLAVSQLPVWLNLYCHHAKIKQLEERLNKIDGLSTANEMLKDSNSIYSYINKIKATTERLDSRVGTLEDATIKLLKESNDKQFAAHQYESSTNMNNIKW